MLAYVLASLPSSVGIGVPSGSFVCDMQWLVWYVGFVAGRHHERFLTASYDLSQQVHRQLQESVTCEKGAETNTSQNGRVYNCSLPRKSSCIICRCRPTKKCENRQTEPGFIARYAILLM